MRWGKSVKITVSPLTPLVLAAFVALSSPILLGALLAAAALHEWGHMAALRHFGGKISHLTVSPFGAEMTIADTARLSYGAEILVTLAGPAVNILLAVVLGLLGDRWESAYVFAGAQLVLGLFNLIPIRPLDGGRLLWLTVAWLTEPFSADRIASASGVIFAVVLFALGAMVFYRTGNSPFLLLGALGLLLSSLREIGLVKSSRAR